MSGEEGERRYIVSVPTLQKPKRRVGKLDFGKMNFAKGLFYSFFEILALCKAVGTAPATRRKNFFVFEFPMQHLLWL